MLKKQSLIRLTVHPAGPRLYLAGRRIHHGLTGLALIASALAHVGPRSSRNAAGAVGAMLVLHDRRDFPFRDCDNH